MYRHKPVWLVGIQTICEAQHTVQTICEAQHTVHNKHYNRDYFVSSYTGKNTSRIYSQIEFDLGGKKVVNNGSAIFRLFRSLLGDHLVSKRQIAILKKIEKAREST